jgi:hypothetical protein
LLKTGKYNPRKSAEELVQRIRTDSLSPGFPNPTQEDVNEIEPYLIIWNLFYGKGYDFSAREFKEVLNILFKERK